MKPALHVVILSGFFLAAFTGCFGPTDLDENGPEVTPAPSATVSSVPSIELPIQSIQFEYPALPLPPRTMAIGLPTTVYDAFGSPRQVLPFAAEGLYPTEKPEPYIAYWDLDSARFVKFSSTYAYGPEHDFWVPYRSMHMLLALGLRNGGVPPAGNETTAFFTESGEWTQRGTINDGRYSITYEAVTEALGETKIRFDYVDGERVPNRIAVLAWGTGQPMSSLYQNGTAYEVLIKNVTYGQQTQIVELPPPYGPSNQTSPPKSKPHEYVTPNGQSFWGPPAADSSLAPFPLSQALALVAAQEETDAFLARHEDVFVQRSSRYATTGTGGVGTELVWSIHLGTGCEGNGEGGRPRLEVSIGMPFEPVALSPAVRSIYEGACLMTHSSRESAAGLPEGVTTQWADLPRQWVTFDQLLGFPPLPEGDPVSVGPKARIDFTASASCYPGSNYAIQFGVNDSAADAYHWFSVTNGQLLQSFGDNDSNIGAPVTARTLECSPSFPGMF